METLEILSCEEQNLLDLANSSDTNYELACLLVNNQSQEFIEYFDRHVVQTFSKGFNLYCYIPTLDGAGLKISIYLENFFIRKSILPKIIEIIKFVDYQCACVDFDKIISDNNKQKFFFKELELNDSYIEKSLIPKIGYPTDYQNCKKLRFSFYLPLLLESEEEARNKYLQIIKDNFILESEDESLIENYELKKRLDSPLVDITFNTKQFLSDVDERLDKLETVIRKDYIAFFRNYFPNILKVLS